MLRFVGTKMHLEKNIKIYEETHSHSLPPLLESKNRVYKLEKE